MSDARVYLHHLGLVCPLGNDHDSVRLALRAGYRGGLVMTDTWRRGQPCTVGPVRGELPRVPPSLGRYASRNARLLLAAAAPLEAPLEELKARHGAARCGVVLGTSTGGIAQGEAAMHSHLQGGVLPEAFHYDQQALNTCAPFLARALGLEGPAWTISTACSSSANALLSARRMLTLGLADVVIAGGADSLCQLTVQGFSALEAVSDAPCNPFSVNRRGINIGEAAALFLVSREPASVALLGGAACSDAYHVSAPQPDGHGAIAAMRGALANARLAPEAVDYLNLHGTATVQNDAMESRAVQAVFGHLGHHGPAASSTKALTGHTLGAAGALEAAFCWLLLADEEDTASGHALPPHCWDGQPDPSLPALNWVQPGQRVPRLNVCLSNSFAFGGNNVALILGRS